jgi:hypothetical protein
MRFLRLLFVDIWLDLRNRYLDACSALERSIEERRR